MKDLCFRQLSLMVPVPASMMLIQVSIEDRSAAELSLQMNQYVSSNMQLDLVVA